MKKIIIPLSALLLLMLCCGALAADNFQKSYEERRRAVAVMMETATVWIVVDDDKSIKSGTGFIVGDGYVVTNAHVVDGMRKGGSIYVLNDLIPARKAEIIAIAHESKKKNKVGARDFALLRFTPPKNVKLAALVLNLTVKRMDRVSAWGYPSMATQFDVSTERLRKGDTKGLTAPPVIYTEGTVNAIVHARSGKAVIHSAQIASGNSGGPLVNSKGEIVGVNTWGYREDDEGAFLNGAQLASELARFLAENGITPQLADGLTLEDYSRKRVEKAEKPQRVEKEERPRNSRPKPKLIKDRKRDVGSFTVLVPEDWSVFSEENNSIVLGSDDRAAAVTITVADREGKSIGKLARELSKMQSGTKPERDEDGMYMFTCSPNDVETLVFVSDLDDGKNFVVLSISGDFEHAGIEEILDSVEDK